MKKYTEKELQKILDEHKTWLSGKGGKRADLSNADLRGANLFGTDLSNADLSNANLTGAVLSGTNLTYANLIAADLIHVNLVFANLSNADLSGADLSGAKLYYADLSDANLTHANLSGVDLTGTKWSNATFDNTLILGEPVQKAPLKLYDLPYPVLITDTIMQIGCQVHSIDEWLAFTVDDIYEMDDDDAKEFYESYGKLIKAAILSHRDPKEENKES